MSDQLPAVKVHPEAMNFWASLCAKYAALYPEKLPALAQTYRLDTETPGPIAMAAPEAQTTA